MEILRLEITLNNVEKSLKGLCSRFHLTESVNVKIYEKTLSNLKTREKKITRKSEVLEKVHEFMHNRSTKWKGKKGTEKY